MSEFELLTRLRSEFVGQFPEAVFSSDMALFRAHFLLFHALYRLQMRHPLEIGALNIRLLPAAEAGGALQDADPMRDYYLDWSQLEQTGVVELEQMLGRFWAGYYARDREGEALRCLGLDAGAGLDQAEDAYRRLAMQHHPDRGGDPGRFVEISEAIAILRRIPG